MLVFSIFRLTTNNHTFTVSQLNSAINDVFKQQLPSLAVSGEISQFTPARSGHWYFTIKDAQEKLDVIMFKNANQALDFTPQVGMNVIVSGSLNLYGPGGRLSLITRQLQEQGQGDLKAKFDRLKQALKNEGLFESEHKRNIPAPPSRVAVVTSKHGAAITDIISTLRRRAPTTPISLFSSSVQGERAVNELIAALELVLSYNHFASFPCDLLIIARGGGSEEDLWCFNDEKLIRYLANYPLPIISGVGHESDVTLTDFVSDFRAETPTAAAEKASEVQAQYTASLAKITARLPQLIRNDFRQKVSRLSLLSRLIASPVQQLNFMHRKLEDLETLLMTKLERTIQFKHNHLTKIETFLGRKHQNISDYESKLPKLYLELQNSTRRIIDKNRTLLQTTSWNYRNFDHVASRQQAMEKAFSNILQTMQTKLVDRKQKLTLLEAVLEKLGPNAILKRGYGIILGEGGSVMTDAASMKSDHNIEIVMHDGSRQAIIR